MSILWIRLKVLVNDKEFNLLLNVLISGLKLSDDLLDFGSEVCSQHGHVGFHLLDNLSLKGAITFFSNSFSSPVLSFTSLGRLIFSCGSWDDITFKRLKLCSEGRKVLNLLVLILELWLLNRFL